MLREIRSQGHRDIYRKIFVEKSHFSPYSHVGRIAAKMLIAFRFRNYRSFEAEAELSLQAHRADKSHASALIHAEAMGREVQLLPAVALYGANAAGKTNVLAALGDIKQAIIASHALWDPEQPIPVERFAGGDSIDDPVSFEIEFILGGTHYRYGFAVAGDTFCDEWLYEHGKGRAKQLFSRSRTKSGKVSIKTSQQFADDAAYIESVKKRTRSNSLFLSAAAQDNHPLAATIRKYFNGMLVSTVWLADESVRSNLTSAFIDESDSFKDSILSLIQAADPSIKDVRVKLKESARSIGGPRNPNNSFFTGGERYDINFIMRSGKRVFELPFFEQSKGVRKLYSLAGEIFAALTNGQIILIDELEAAMHPHLARMIVDLFQSASANPSGAQLIFTTHDTNLLDQDLLRRDQIWFVEKEQCSSRLYSLLDFSPRKDSNLETGYLRGRYGAIPVARMPQGWLSPERVSPGIEMSDAP